MKTVLLSILATTVLAQPPAPPADKGSIEGVVINQITNAPIKKAQVNVDGMQVATDASGHFAVEQLAPGAYDIFASHPTFPPPMTSSSRLNVRVTLGPGEHKKDVSIALLPGVSISGKVLDEDSDPLSGCFVQVMRYTYQGGKKELQQMNGAGSDDRGEYRISNLASGSYYLKTTCRQPVRAPRPFGPKDAVAIVPEETYTDQFYPGASDADAATKLKPPPGAELRDIDFRMRRLRAVSILGKVTRPAGGDTNEYLQAYAVPKNGSDRRLLRASRLLPSGEFEIHGLLPGSYWLTAANYDQESPLFGRIEIDVGDSPLNNVVLPVSPGFTLSGTVEMESPPSGQPPSPEPASAKAPNRRVRLFLFDGINRFQRRTAEVQNDGAFSLSGVTPGDWKLDYEPLLPGTYVKSLQFGDKEVSPERLTIAEGGAGVLKLVIGGNPGHVDGTVQVDNSQSAGNIEVMLLPDAPSQPEFQRAAQTVTDSAGRFSFPGIAPGKYRLCALERGPNFPQGSWPGDVLKNLGEEVTVEEGGHVTKQIKLIPTSAIADALRDLE